MRILIVEDQEGAYKQLEEKLLEKSYKVEWVRNSGDAVNFVRESRIEAAIVDLQLAGERDGGQKFIDYCFKENTFFPILILSIKTFEEVRKEFRRYFGDPRFLWDEVGRVVDYVCKRPEKDWTAEVCGRLERWLKPDKVWSFPPYKFNTTENEFYRGKDRLELRGSQKKLLQLLMRFADTVVPYWQIYQLTKTGQSQEYFEDDENQKNAIQAFVSGVRGELNWKEGKDPILNKEGGYCFVVPKDHEVRVYNEVHNDSLVVDLYQLITIKENSGIKFYSLTIKKPGTRLDLDYTEYRILEFLMQHVGAMCSLQRIHEHTYGSNDTTALSVLKSKLKELKKKVNGEVNGIPEPRPLMDHKGYYCFSPPLDHPKPH